MKDIIRVVIVDDHFVTRQGIISLLSRNERIEVVGEGSAGEHILMLLAEHKPDILITDLQMPAQADRPESGWFEPVRVLKQAVTEYSSTAVIVLSQEHDAQTIQSLAEIGVQGYLLKADRSARSLDSVVEIIYSGNPYFSPDVQTIIYSAAPIRDDSQLTEAHLALLRMVARYPDSTRKELATRLNVSPNTIHSHITAIYNRMGTANMVSTILKAMRMGLIK
jgi:DNA-binding NarL/FixJ family response regulator